VPLRRSGPLAVHEYGDPTRPVLLVLHGITDSGPCWADLVERLGSSYRIVAPDSLGHGASERFTPEQLRSEHPAEHMYAPLEDLLGELGPCLVLGHSMGGGLGAALTARRPDLVRAAVLEDPAWSDRSAWGDEEEVTRKRVADAQAVAADPETAIAQCRAEHPAWPESELRPWAQAKADSDLDLLATGSARVGTPWREVVAAITPPTLVVTGDGEVILRPPLLDEVARLNPALEVAVVPGADHCVRRDRGDAFHAVVDPWLAAHA
jgi:lipase